MITMLEAAVIAGEFLTETGFSPVFRELDEMKLAGDRWIVRFFVGKYEETYYAIEISAKTGEILDAKELGVVRGFSGSENGRGDEIESPSGCPDRPE